MEKFKNALKSVNKFGLVALVLVAFATMAFKTGNQKNSNTLLTEYGRQSNGEWVEVGSATPGENPGQYTCDIASLPCRALFESQPQPEAEPAPENIVQANGEFSINP